MYHQTVGPELAGNPVKEVREGGDGAKLGREEGWGEFSTQICTVEIAGTGPKSLMNSFSEGTEKCKMQYLCLRRRYSMFICFKIGMSFSIFKE